MQFSIPKARVKKSNFINQKYYTVVMVPAADEFSQPSSLKLKSDVNLGNPGEDISVNVLVSGFVREKTYNDKKTGELKHYDEQNVYLFASPSRAK